MDLSETSDNVNRHPWELSRTRCMLKEIKRMPSVERVLDIGCGDGFFDKVLVQEDARIKSLVGYDIFLSKPYSEGCCAWTNDFDSVPDHSFDLILMMDVLEHVQEDSLFFQQVCQKLKSHGRILITVPAFMKLYSIHDEKLKHFRRYNRYMLKSVVYSGDCEIITESYFYFPLVLLRILTKNRVHNIGMWKYDKEHIITKTITAILNIDYDLMRLLSSFHIYICGLSLLMIVRQRDVEK